LFFIVILNHSKLFDGMIFVLLINLLLEESQKIKGERKGSTHQERQ